MTQPTSPREGYVYIGARACTGCGALIHWWRTLNGKPSPHDQDGTTHFATCPKAARFRRPRKPREGQP